MQDSEVTRGISLWYRLIELAGPAAAVRFVEEYGGENIYLPVLDRLIRPLRDKEIRRLHQKGMNVNSLAVEFGLSKELVRYIVKEK